MLKWREPVGYPLKMLTMILKVSYQYAKNESENIKMVAANELKAGMTFETDGKLLRVLEASQPQTCKGNTIMRMKLRDVRTGSTFDTSYRPEENLIKRLSKHIMRNISIKWMTQLISWIMKLMINMKFQWQMLQMN